MRRDGPRPPRLEVAKPREPAREILLRTHTSGSSAQACLSHGAPRVLRFFVSMLVPAACVACSGSPGAPAAPVAVDDSDGGGGGSMEAGALSNDAGAVPESSTSSPPDAAKDGAADAPAAPPPDASTNDAAQGGWDASGPWMSVSYGVTTKDTGTGNDIVIAYGGYTATDADS